MYDAETVSTQLEGKAEKSAVSQTTTRISLLKRNAARKLTRAHVELARRPAFVAEANDVLVAVAAELGRELGTELKVEASLIENAINPFGGLSKFSVYALIELAPLAQKAVLEIDLLTLNALLEKVAGSAARSGPMMKLTAIEEAAFGWLLLQAVATVRRQSAFYKRFGARLLSLHTERGEVLERVDCRLKHVGVELKVHLGDQIGLARLLVPALGVQVATQDVAVQLPPEVAPEVLAAQLSARVFAGRTILATADLRALAIGDVVLFDRLKPVDGSLAGQCRLVTQTFELHGELSQQSFTLTRAQTRALNPEPKMLNPDEEKPLPPLPVELEIELARIQIPVSELAMLRAGAVLPLRINASEPVTLRIGDRAVAKAELVEIDGEVGARIIGLVKS